MFIQNAHNAESGRLSRVIGAIFFLCNIKLWRKSASMSKQPSTLFFSLGKLMGLHMYLIKEISAIANDESPLIIGINGRKSFSILHIIWIILSGTFSDFQCESSSLVFLHDCFHFNGFLCVCVCVCWFFWGCFLLLLLLDRITENCKHKGNTPLAV